MKIHSLLEDSPLDEMEGERVVSNGFEITIDKIREVHQGNAKGVIVYGSLEGCPYCERFESTWKGACESCPRGVFTVKILMQDIPEHHRTFGSKPRLYPAVYGFVRGKDGRVHRYDYSQDRDRLDEIMKAISMGHNVEPSGDGPTEDVSLDSPGQDEGETMMENQLLDDYSSLSSSDEEDDSGRDIKIIGLSEDENPDVSVKPKKSPKKRKATLKQKASTSRRTMRSSAHKEVASTSRSRHRQTKGKKGNRRGRTRRSRKYPL